MARRVGSPRARNTMVRRSARLLTMWLSVPRGSRLVNHLVEGMGKEREHSVRPKACLTAARSNDQRVEQGPDPGSDRVGRLEGSPDRGGDRVEGPPHGPVPPVEDLKLESDRIAIPIVGSLNHGPGLGPSGQGPNRSST